MQYLINRLTACGRANFQSVCEAVSSLSEERGHSKSPQSVWVVRQFLRIFHGKDKRSKGCGYIEFTPHNTGRRAISILNGSLLLGKHKIEAKKFHDRRKNKSPKRKPVAKCPSNREVNSAPLPVVAPSTPKEDDGEFVMSLLGL